MLHFQIDALTLVNSNKLRTLFDFCILVLILLTINLITKEKDKIILYKISYTILTHFFPLY